MSNELCKCGKVGKISCPNDDRCGTNPQLPAEAEEQHKRLIKALLELGEDKRKVLTYDNTRLKGELEGYKVACEELKKENEKLKATTTGWRTLLEEILEMDKQDIAYISEELIEKIKRFLYGE